MELLISIFVFIFGLIIGSFLNVVILRYGTKKSISTGHSMCPNCHKRLYCYELVPVLSYVFQFGKCTKCKNKISIQYPLVELATGILFVSVLYKDWFPACTGMTNCSDFVNYGASVILAQAGIQTLIMLIAICLLIVIFVYDLYHKIIPDLFSFSFGILGLIYMFINFEGWNLLAPIIFFLPFFLLWRISNGTWIGLGDGKLAFGFGGFLGLVYGLSALVLSFWIGAAFAIYLMLITQLNKDKKTITMKSEIAFGPFMIIGFLIVYFFQFDVMGISNLVNVL